MIRDGSLMADGDVILRNIDEDDLYADGRIKYRAFLVRMNGKDNNGLSVTAEVVRSRAELCTVTGEDFFCRFHG